MTAAEPAWVIRDDVPLTDAHVLSTFDPATGKPVKVRVDEARLKRIADKVNGRIGETGDDCPVVIGHTRDDLPETEQPPIVGYADSFRVEKGPGDRPTLYCRFKLYPESEIDGRTMTADEVLRSWPRRSPEIWFGREDIDPISLLGATTPMRFTGLVRYRRPRAKVRYQRQNMDLATFLQALQALIQQASGAPAAGPDNPAAGGEQPVQYAAGCAGENGAYAPSDEPEKVRMQREQLAIRLNQLEADAKRRDAEVEDLRVRYRRSVREKDLIQLEAEGYQFDRTEELEAVAKLENAEYEGYVGRLRKRYQRVPTGDLIRTAPAREGGGKPAASRDDVDRAVKVAGTKKISYEQALAEVMAG